MKISPVLYSTAADKPVSGANTLYFKAKLSDATFSTATVNLQTLTVTITALTTSNCDCGFLEWDTPVTTATKKVFLSGD